ALHAEEKALHAEEQGEAKMLARLLARRFGPLPEWAEVRLWQANRAQLESWFDVALDAGSLAEVFGEARRG
ncbi:MAG: DUF4351 domain-containing protein, partial [Azoarcus sp.]|nr:DUF4351 domain-containing protein [Azoarcus sp.]